MGHAKPALRLPFGLVTMPACRYRSRVMPIGPTNNQPDEHTRPLVAAVLVAGGRGQRAGDGVPKQYRLLAGKTMIRRAADALQVAGVDLIQPVIHPDDRPLFDAAMADGPSTLPPVDGGLTRQASGLNGLRALRELNPSIVLIHDAARPFARPGVINRVLDALDAHAAVIPALPVFDTLRRGDDDGLAGDTISRDGLWRVQTPQGFDYAEILAAHEALTEASGEMTDDAAIAAAAGLSVQIVPGDEENIKVTTQNDFDRAERYLASRSETRIGTGFDVHRLGPGSFVTLCGVEIPHDFGLVGHSDADVAWHSLTDALLGAIGAGDIGSHFPPSDPMFKGAPSEMFLARAAELVRAHRGQINNVDVTIICEAPKVGPHRSTMIAETARVLDIDPSRVSIKATTTEGLGLTGRREGIAAQAMASVKQL